MVRVFAYGPFQVTAISKGSFTDIFNSVFKAYLGKSNATFKCSAFYTDNIFVFYPARKYYLCFFGIILCDSLKNSNLIPCINKLSEALI